MKDKKFLIEILIKLTKTDFIPLDKYEVKKIKEIIKEMRK